MTEQLKSLLEEFSEWRDFVTTMEALPETVWASSLEPGKWSIKSIVSHIMLWDLYFLEAAIEPVAHGKPLTLKHLNYDDFNREAPRRGEELSVEELVAQSVSVRGKIIELIGGLSDEAVSNRYPDADGNDFRIIPYLKDFIGHDQQHRKPLEAYLQNKH